MEIKHTLVVLDLETTGVWVEKDKIVEIAMIKCYPDGTRKQYLQRVNPGILIPPQVTKLIGISNEDVRDEPYFKKIAHDVLQFTEDADLAGFNIERFDLPLLEREMFESGLKFDWQKRTIYDAQKIYHLKEKRDLTAAYRFYCDKDLENAHTALADAQATLEILGSQVERYGENRELISLGEFNYATLSDFYDEGRRFRWWNGKLYPMFGKYAKRYSLQEMAQKDPKYLEWILSSDFNDDVKVLVQDALQGKFPIYEGN